MTKVGLDALGTSTPLESNKRLLACLPCMGILRLTETRHSYANWWKKEECNACTTVSRTNVCQTGLPPTLHHKGDLWTSCCTTDTLDAGEGVACGSGVSGCLAVLARGARMRNNALRTGILYAIVEGSAFFGSRYPR